MSGTTDVEISKEAQPTDEFLHRLTERGLSQREIARLVGLTRDTVLYRLRRYKKNKDKVGKVPEQKIDTEENIEKLIENYKSSVQINEDGSQVSDRLVRMMEEERKNPRRLLELHNYDPDEWILVRAVDNLWHMMRSYRVGGGSELLYQSKITVKPKTGAEFFLEDVDRFFSEINTKTPKAVYTPKQHKPNGDVLEICLSDLHKGNRAIYEMTDIDQICHQTVKDVMNRCDGRKFSKIYITPLGDVFHFDTIKRTTTCGTPLETNGATLQEMFDNGVELFVWILDSLSQIAPVEYIHVPGNHDGAISYTFAKSLECWYRNNKHLTIDASHKPRKWRVIYSALVAWMHGDMSKGNEMGWLMSEAREEWGNVKYAEIHVGHLHSQQTIEKNGTILRRLPSMTGTDEWHYNKGYVGSVKATVSFVWGRDGLKEIWQTNTG